MKLSGARPLTVVVWPRAAVADFSLADLCSVSTYRRRIEARCVILASNIMVSFFGAGCMLLMICGRVRSQKRDS